MENEAAPVIETPNTPAPDAGGAPAGATPAPEPKSGGPLTAEQLIELKVNGTSRKYTLDQLKARASLADASHERFEKASQIEKSQKEYDEKLKKDFIGALVEKGLSKEQIKTRFEQWYKENFIDPETMSPEQKELAELKRWKQQQEQERQEIDEQKKSAEQKEFEQKERQNYQKEIIETIEKFDLPKTRFIVGRIAYWQGINLSKGYDAPPEVVVQQVREEEQSILKNAVKSRMANPEKLVEYLGEDVVNAIRKFDVERLKKKFGVGSSNQSAGGTQFPTNERRGKTMSDVDDYFNELRRSKR